MRLGFSILFFFYSLVFWAQNKQDYVWLFGYDRTTVTDGTEGYTFNFNKNNGDYLLPLQNVIPFEISGNNASISDENGNLLFYTNGCHVADADHNIMPNSAGINEGEWLDQTQGGNCNYYLGTHNICIVPDPAYDKGYYILHKTVIPDIAKYFELRYSYVDMSLNNGKGDVTTKNIVLSEDLRLQGNYLSINKHSNGTDWWILQAEKESNRILTLLIDETGPNDYSLQTVDHTFENFSSSSGCAAFSPDGNYYAYYNAYDNLLLFDFDRATGVLSNLRTLELSDVSEPDIAFSTLEWSPNSQYLYIAADNIMYQLDTYVDDFEDGVELIDVWDGTSDPFATTFNLMALAPDCKIYMCSGSSTNTYHVINNPNEKGTACDFVQHGIRLPFTSSVAAMPYYPRFRVDEEDKCDPTITSIFGDHVYYRRDMTVYPNPVRDILNVEIPEGKKGRLVVFDMMGRLVWSGKYDGYSGEVRVDLSQLAIGTYSVEFLPEDNRERLVFTAQIVKVE